MPVIKTSRRPGLSENVFIPGGSELLKKIGCEYANSPEKEECDRIEAERVVGVASIMDKVVGYEI